MSSLNPTEQARASLVKVIRDCVALERFDAVYEFSAMGGNDFPVLQFGHIFDGGNAVEVIENESRRRMTPGAAAAIMFPDTP